MKKLLLSLDQEKCETFKLTVIVLENDELDEFSCLIGNCLKSMPPEFVEPYISRPGGIGPLADIIKEVGYLPFVKVSSGTLPVFQRYEVEDKIMSMVIAPYANSWVNYLLECPELPFEIDPGFSDPFPQFSSN